MHSLSQGLNKELKFILMLETNVVAFDSTVSILNSDKDAATFCIEKGIDGFEQSILVLRLFEWYLGEVFKLHTEVL